MQQPVPHQVINFKKNTELPYIIDVELQNLPLLRQFDAVECHIVVFPYSRQITTNDITMRPFQDYAEDIAQQQKSAYMPLSNSSNKRFGLLLGLILVTIVLVFRPEDLTSVEAIASMFGAYVVGKELWNDLVRFLTERTKNRRLRFIDNYYSYQLEKSTTLVQYASFAMKHRYGEIALHPQRMEYLEQSSSKTVRMWFEKEDFNIEGDTAHLLSLRLKPELVQELENEGYMLGVKLSLHKKKWWRGLQTWEYFQSWSKGEKGSLDAKGIWQKNAAFYRKTYLLGQWKYFKTNGCLQNTDMVGFYE